MDLCIMKMDVFISCEPFIIFGFMRSQIVQYNMRFLVGRHVPYSFIHKIDELAAAPSFFVERPNFSFQDT